MDSQEQRSSGTGISRALNLSMMLIVLTLLAAPASAQILVAVDDSYGVPFAEALVVEDPGVMENDTYDGAPAAEEGGMVELVTPPGNGVLDCESDPVPYDLCPDGSFIYTPGSGFTGFDSFTYEVTVGAQTQQATVTLTACTGGPTQYVCWQESAYLAQLGVLGGFELIQEGFEDDVAWGVTRDPLTEPSVVSQGVRWETNHPDPPASNELITGSGPARYGLWGLYDPEHGYATGTPSECDINDPPVHCLFKDGFTGTWDLGGTMFYGAGGYLKGAAGPNLSMILDGGTPIGLGRLSGGGHQFFGVIDTGGFSSFRVEETDSKVGQERYVFGDDFTLATTVTDTTPPQVTLVNSWDDTGDGELTEGETTDAAIYQLLVSFSEPVRDVGSTDANSVTNPANYLLVSDGGNGFETASCSGGVAGNDVQISVDWVAWEASSVMTADLDLNDGVDLPVANYRLLVCGTTSIHDWAGNVLDGNGNGTGGDDFVRNFTVYYTPNDPPTANPQSVSTAEDTAKAIILTGSDPNSDPLTFSIVAGPTHGGLSGTPPNVTYTPALNYHGADSFTFRVWDGTVFSDPATVSMTVTAINDAPVADAGPDQAAFVTDTVTLDGSGSFDVDGDPLTYAWTFSSVPPGSAASLSDPMAVLPTFVADEPGDYVVELIVWDGTVFSAPDTVTVTVIQIADPVLTIGDANVSELDFGTTNVTLTINVSEPSPVSITVDFATADGSAVAGLDYVAASGTLTIPALALNHELVVEVNGDLLDEPDETFAVTLSSPVGATLGVPSSGTVDIFDNDPMAELSAAGVVVGEAAGTADVSLTLNGPSGFEVTVDYATADGSAVAPEDYEAVNGGATIPQGSTSTVIAVAIINDGEVEIDESFSIEFSTPNNAILMTSSITVTIVDDDGCNQPGDADGNCVLDAADISLIVSYIDDPSLPLGGNADCDGSGLIDSEDLVCAVQMMMAQ